MSFAHSARRVILSALLALTLALGGGGVIHYMVCPGSSLSSC